MTVPPRILLLGRQGQVGWELQRSLAPLGELVALDRQGLSPQAAMQQGLGVFDHPLCGDLECPDELIRTVEALRPDVIVNAAAYTAVDRAESHVDQARRINAQAPGALAQVAQRIGAWLVHYSTDYVFSGTGHRPWTEDDPTGPVNVYGLTKLEGEQHIVAAGCRHLIFRTSWVYASRGSNFAKTMLRLARERERLTVINDQFGAPTGADLIADVTAHALRQVLRTGEGAGIYHLAPTGETHWHAYAGYAIAVARQWHPDLGWKVQVIDPIPTASYPTPARRPHNSRLCTDRLQQVFGLRLPPWDHGVARMVQEVLG